MLVSLARAGTPVGVLMRRWARHAHGLDLPHYAVSIVRGRGIDTTALRWLAAHHDPADVVFVDGWTGKGAITRELAAGPRRTFPGFDPRIAVLADPGGCVDTYGTRDDFLIPSACLNSTVSGLISRTVLRDDLVGPDDFHGAKFYRELAATDVSRAFLDAVSARFDDVADGRRRGGEGAGRRRPGPHLGGLGGRRADQRGVRHPRRQPRQARGRRDHARAAAPGALEDPGPAGRRAPTSTMCACWPNSGACPSKRSTNCPTPASG